MCADEDMMPCLKLQNGRENNKEEHARWSSRAVDDDVEITSVTSDSSSPDLGANGRVGVCMTPNLRMTIRLKKECKRRERST